MPDKKSGFIAVIGKPNAGKSTLMNTILGQKVAIMSDKPQTTRTLIRGILTRDEGQLVFLDTPGIHKPRHRLGEVMNEVAEEAMHEVDVLLCVVDATVGEVHLHGEILSKIKKSGRPAILALNKVDLLAKEQLLKLIADYQQEYDFLEIIPVSAKTGDQVDKLIQLLFQHVSEGPFYYPEGVVTDHPEAFLMAELIREKVLYLTHEEIPHSVAVQIEHMEFREDNQVLYVHAIIYTERDSQKAILIGKEGKLLKRVGTLARRDMEGLFHRKVFLDLWIKVKKDWRNHEHLIRSFGLERD